MFILNYLTNPVVRRLSARLNKVQASVSEPFSTEVTLYYPSFRAILPLPRQYLKKLRFTSMYFSVNNFSGQYNAPICIYLPESSHEYLTGGTPQTQAFLYFVGVVAEPFVRVFWSLFENVLRFFRFVNVLKYIFTTLT